MELLSGYPGSDKNFNVMKKYCKMAITKGGLGIDGFLGCGGIDVDDIFIEVVFGLISRNTHEFSGYITDPINLRFDFF